VLLVPMRIEVALWLRLASVFWRVNMLIHPLAAMWISIFTRML